MSHTPICALATGSGGAIAIIRISGEGCIPIADKIFHSYNHSPLTHTPANTIRLGVVVATDGQQIDEALFSIFQAPHSYTGEDSVEISLHASPYIINETLHTLCAAGCRMAEPGEFTQRAFLAGKIDLSQAEAVADLIAANTAAAHKVALSQLKGSFSSKLSRLTNDLQQALALLELELDFDEHETMEFADRSELRTLIQNAIQNVSALIDSYATGKALKWGVPVAIVGKTNVGKSTLLNRLLRQERAIVSPIHGTTRDTIEDTITLHGVPFRFIDTAGLRNTNDTVEQIGIARTHQAIERAQIILYVFDTIPTNKEINEIRKKTDGKETIFIHNKADLLAQQQYQTEKKQENPNATQNPTEVKQTGFSDVSQNSTSLPHPLSHAHPTSAIFISAKNDTDLTPLEEAIYQAAHLQHWDSTETIVTSARHHEALCHANEALKRAETALAQTDITPDLISEELRLATNYLATITGHTITPETTLQHLFSHFCVGK